MRIKIKVLGCLLWTSGLATALGAQGGASRQDFTLERNHYLEANTSFTNVVLDSHGRAFTIHKGVLKVRDFTLESGATIRARGTRPLVIQVSGRADIEGSLDASGNPARQPTSFNSPQFPEPGAFGECGGGRGGTASWVTTAETTRGGAGEGPFGLQAQSGGRGGESAFQQSNFLTGWNDAPYYLAGGGGGGGFASGPNAAVSWSHWTGFTPPGEGTGPDGENKRGEYPLAQIFGAEAGVRGSSVDSNQTRPDLPHGAHGMEDGKQDAQALDDFVGLNPSASSFDRGDPRRGPDPGSGGRTVFRNVRDDDDFWGYRRHPRNVITTGELLRPWAGSGGGAGGDSQLIERRDLDGDGKLDPLVQFWPDWNFPFGSTWRYRKGAPGGGGGGLLMLLVEGEIRLGPQARLKVNGGNGAGGESVVFGHRQISGSGGGSGGHLILLSRTGLDLSAISVGSASTAKELAQLTAVDLVQAIGGRRGWSGSEYDLTGAGNGDFMLGRGGAGANGVIQIHVPRPAQTIRWHPDSEAGIRDYLSRKHSAQDPAGTPRLERILNLFTEPTPWLLLPVLPSL